MLYGLRRRTQFRKALIPVPDLTVRDSDMCDVSRISGHANIKPPLSRRQLGFGLVVPAGEGEVRFVRNLCEVHKTFPFWPNGTPALRIAKESLRAGRE